MTTQRGCDLCGVAFTRAQVIVLLAADRRYCTSCAAFSREMRADRRPLVARTCRRCGRSMLVADDSLRCCSRVCTVEDQRTTRRRLWQA